MSSHRAHILSATQSGQTVHLHFQMGLADGVTLLSRRGPEQDYSALTEDEPGPVVDARPNLNPDLPETRCYLAILRYSAGDIVRFTNEIVLTVPEAASPAASGQEPQKFSSFR